METNTIGEHIFEYLITYANNGFKFVALRTDKRAEMVCKKDGTEILAKDEIQAATIVRVLKDGLRKFKKQKEIIRIESDIISMTEKLNKLKS